MEQQFRGRPRIFKNYIETNSNLLRSETNKAKALVHQQIEIIERDMINRGKSRENIADIYGTRNSMAMDNENEQGHNRRSRQNT